MNLDYLRASLGTIILLCVVAILASLPYPEEGSEEPVIVARTRATVRENVRRTDLEEIIRPGLALPTTADYAKQWRRTLSTMKWTGYRAEDAIPPLKALCAAQGLPDSTRRLLFETIHALFPKGFTKEMSDAVNYESDPRRFCMAASWLAREADYATDFGASMERLLVRRFPNWKEEPRFEALHASLRLPRREALADRPPIAALLEAPFDGKPVIYSLQRLTRIHQGLAIFRDSAGKFLREESGRLVAVPQLAQAVNDLPATITNGNTPQGIFEVRTISHGTIAPIGPTETVVLGLPGEYDKTWTSERYQALLPESWRNYWPIYEAWWAGQAGRFDIIAHGTTVDPYPWRDLPFYPNTPSHGCLKAVEVWDPGNGQRVISEQVRLVKALRQIGGPPGWLVLAELDDAPQSVTRSEAEALLRQR